MKKQELSEKELGKVCGGVRTAADFNAPQLLDAGTVSVELGQDKLDLSWKNLGQIR